MNKNLEDPRLKQRKWDIWVQGKKKSKMSLKVWDKGMQLTSGAMNDVWRNGHSLKSEINSNIISPTFSSTYY